MGESEVKRTQNKTFANICCSGGVRGIVELEVLKAIETALGGDLPIQAFFDLIVGTRYALPVCLDKPLADGSKHWRHHCSRSRHPKLDS